MPTGAWTDLPIAQLRFEPATAMWTLRCRDRNERWTPYRRLPASGSVAALLAEIDADPTGIFWG